jgi:oligopeptide transport system ATP-binding protein
VSEPALLEVRDLEVHFPVRGRGWLPARRMLRAVDQVSFAVRPGEVLGVVGESGCGKSTLLRAILRLIPVSAGSVRLSGVELTTLEKAALRPLRRRMQIVFQDPLASLDPRMTVGEIIAEPLAALLPGLARAERRQRVERALQQVGLLPAQINRYPHEFSGGQAQRIGIARALVVEPQLLICDEPVSALDVSIKAQIINLLLDLRAGQNLTYIFVAHDLATVRHIADRVMVLYLGRVVEITDRDALYAHPLHPYTRLLLSAVPIPDPVRARAHRAAPGRDELPSPLALPSGCTFRTRCPLASERCAAERPPLRQIDGRVVACHHAQAAAGQP